MKKTLDQLKTVWAEMSPTRRWLTGGLLASVLVGFAVIIALQTRTDWADLGRGYTPEDQKAAVAALEAKKIPVRLRDGGIIQVPTERLDAARVEIAQTAATGGSVGMELFNESNFGQSRFQEAVNYHRALQGELERTIRSIDGIDAARVHLVIPKKSLFKRQQKKPTASIKLKLKKTFELSKRQIGGIKHLVASAIEGLKPTAVTIIDQLGNVLARPSQGGLAAGETYYELQANYERKMEQRVVELLEPLLGEGKVQAQVSAVMNFSHVEMTEKQIDADKQVVLTEKRTEETSKTADAKPAGVPGVAANLPGGTRGAKTEGQNSRTARKEDTRYDAPTTVTKTSTPVGRLTRLSVAVAVDGQMKENEAGETVWQPLDVALVKQLEELVSKAVGIDESRGDQLAVVNTQFQTREAIPDGEEAAGLAPWLHDVIQWGALVLLLLVLVFGVVRPMIKMSSEEPDLDTQLALAGAGAYDGAAESVVAGALPEPEPELPHGERLRLQAINSTRQDPERAVQIIRAWLMAEE